METISLEMKSVVVEHKIRKLPIKLPKSINKNFRIPRKVKKKMKARLGDVGYNYWYCMYIKSKLK
jgi:hypothetical protein